MTHYRSWEPLLPASALVSGTALVVAPHPDDELIGCGGVIMAHRERGVSVHVVVMTDGGLGNPSGEGGPDYRALRREETERSVETLGGAHVHFLDHPDGSLRTTLKPVEELIQIFQRVDPRVVFFPSPYEIHPDHRATCLLTFRALRALGTKPRIFLYEVGAMMPANCLVDITPYMLKKEEAIGVYQSQILHQDLIGKTRALNRCRTVNVDDPSIRYAEAFLHVIPDRIDRFLSAVEELLMVTDGMAPSAS